MFNILRLQIGSLLVMIYVAFIYFSTKRQKSLQHFLFTSLIIFSTTNVVSEICKVYTVVNIETIPVQIVNLSHIVFMESILISVFISFIYVCYMIKPIPDKKGLRLLILILIVTMVLIAVTPIHYKTENVVINYSYGTSVSIAYLSVAFFLLLTVISVVMKYKEIHYKKRKPIIIALIFESVSYLGQFFIEGSLTTSIGTTLLVLSFYLTLESPDIQLIKQLSDEKERADHANKVKTEFLRNMSHEIRTPINTIVGMNEMIIRESNQKEIIEFAQDIKNSSKLLLSIINDILDFSKIESGKTELVCVEYNLRNLLHDEYVMFSAKVKNKGLTLNFDIAPEIPCHLKGDDMRIKQILTNIINNAVKYTQQGEITVNVKLVSLEGEIAKLFFSVKDTGAGIKEEDIANLFEVFKRIDEEKNRNIEGTGLGLNIVINLLKLMGSTLNVESEYGKGSEFFFYLDQPVVSDEKIGNFSEFNKNTDTSDIVISSLTAKNVTILVVDDNLMNLKVIRSYLNKTGIVLHEADSGMKCCELVKENKYDLILMDHMMPEMDGVETFKRLKEMENNLSIDTPVVMLTATAVSGMKEYFIKEGFSDYITKPVNSETLLNTIAKMIPEKTSCQQKEANKNIEIPVIDGMDMAYAKIHFTGDEQLYEAIKTFKKFSDTEISQLESYYSENFTEETLASYRIKVHAMKNSAAIIGIIPLAGMAKMLENAAVKQNTEAIHKLHPIFVRKWNDYKIILKDFCNDEDDEEKISAETDSETIEQLISALYQAAQDIDLGLLDDIMKELNCYKFEGDKKELIENLSKAVDLFDVDEIQSIIDKYNTINA